MTLCLDDSADLLCILRATPYRQTYNCFEFNMGTVDIIVLQKNCIQPDEFNALLHPLSPTTSRDCLLSNRVKK